MLSIIMNNVIKVVHWLSSHARFSFLVYREQVPAARYVYMYVRFTLVFTSLPNTEYRKFLRKIIGENDVKVVHNPS